jgi:hypothetical protein
LLQEYFIKYTGYVKHFKEATMAKMKGLILVILVFILYAIGSSADDNGWHEAFKITSGRLLCIDSIDGSDTLYIGTNEGLYKTQNAGKNREKVRVPAEVAGVNKVAVCGEKVVIAAEKGIYISKQGSWKHLGSSSLWRSGISDVACENGTIYVASGGNIYRLSDDGNKWDRISVLKEYKETNGNASFDEFGSDEPEEVSTSLLSNIIPDGRGNIMLATASGIFTINERNGARKHISTTGLPSSRVRFIARSGGELFAATDKKVFLYSGAGKAWRTVFEAPSGDISFLEASIDGKGRKWLWVSSGRSLYKREASFPEPAKLTRWSYEPSIREVHRMAVDYAEVAPEKIKRWRAGARWKALLPKLSFGISESNDDKVEIYTSSTRSYHYTAPREVDSGWDIDLTWDLSDLVWNDSQTNIDVRSKLMVQLRDEILEDVTRLYFERKRLLASLGADPENERKRQEKELRVEELTAHIDALTGGGFSDIINKE